MPSKISDIKVPTLPFHKREPEVLFEETEALEIAIATVQYNFWHIDIIAAVFIFT